MSPKDPPASVLTDTSRSSSVVSELQATPSMCHHCFDVLIQGLRGSNHYDPSLLPFPLPAAALSAKKPDFLEEIPPGESECPLFVTWDKKRPPRHHHHHHHHHDDRRFELRGCIGTHSHKPLATSVGEYATIAAFSDKRFHPISLAELPLLRVAVSLLIRYEPCEHCHDWTVGIHGIIIGWVDDSGARGGREYSATYLPEVAAEQGWDQVAAVESLIRKAGYHGRITSSLLQQIRCTRYQSSKARASFDDYLAARRGEVGQMGDSSTSIDGGQARSGSGPELGRARDFSSSSISSCVVS